MKFINYIPADRDPLLPYWFPMRKVLSRPICAVFGHRLVSNLPAMAHSMVPYYAEQVQKGTIVPPPPSCIDCGRESA